MKFTGRRFIVHGHDTGLYQKGCKYREVDRESIGYKQDKEKRITIFVLGTTENSSGTENVAACLPSILEEVK